MSRRRRARFALWMVLVAVVGLAAVVAPAVPRWYRSVAYKPTDKTLSVKHTGSRFAIIVNSGGAVVGSVEAEGFELEGEKLDPRDFDHEKKFRVLGKRWDWLPGSPERTVEME